MSNLVDHAKRELALIESDEAFIDAIVKSVEAFAAYGHSGGSASVGIHILNNLLQFKNLSPLTDDPTEWINHGNSTWQSCRNSEAFSNDGGITYYLLSERSDIPGVDTPIHNSNKSIKEN